MLGVFVQSVAAPCRRRGYNYGEEELYDLASDPYQLSNLLAGTPTPETEALREQLLTQLQVLCAPPPPGVRF